MLEENKMVNLYRENGENVKAAEINGEDFTGNTIPEAQRAVARYNAEQDGRFTASMPLLLLQFPHSQWYNTNSEDIVGIDTYGKFGQKKQPVVATYHGGRDSKWGLLPPEKIELALGMYRKSEGMNTRKGLNKVYAAVFNDIYTNSKGEPIDVIRQLLNEGAMPDGRTIPVFSYGQMLAGETPNVMDFASYVVVRPLALARKTVSGYVSIDRLTDSEGRISPGTGSQVIAYAGGVNEAQNVIDRAKSEFTSRKLGVGHPFNLDAFNPKEAQGRVLFRGNIGNDGLRGFGSLNSSGRYLGVGRLIK